MKKLLSMLLVVVMFITCLPLSNINVNAATYEYAMFPMSYLNISQGVNGSYSHSGTNAIDITGKDSGIDTAYAPFTGVIKRIYQGYVVWLESSNPVIFADGTIDYMTIMVMHDNDTSDLYVGKVIKQGDRFFEEGTTGKATGNHIHLECAKGKFKGTGWYENSYGQWMIYNSILPYNALFLSSSTIVKNGYGYSWKYKTQSHTTHSYTKYVWFEASHPHYKCYQCSCGDVKRNTAEPIFYDQCSECMTFTTINNGTYFIRNKANGSYMDVANSVDANNSNIGLCTYNGSTAQQYTISYSDNNTNYAIQPLCSSTRVVNGYGNTISSGANVCLWDNTYHASQRWKFKKTTGGYVIHNALNPSCVMDCSSDNIYLNTYNGNASQTWTILNSITYNANGGSGAPNMQMKEYGVTTTLSTTKPTRSGYDFLGWSTSANATKPSYNAGSSYSANANITLYAVWQKHTTHTYKSTTVTKATLSKNGSIVKKCSVCGTTTTTTIKYAKTFTLSTTSYTYDGKVKKPGVTVKDSAGKTLKKDTDYTVSYEKDPKKAGTYKVTVKMKGNYSGTKTLTYKINPLNVSTCKISLSKTAFTYNGKVQKPTVTVKNKWGTKLTTSSYTVTYSSGLKQAGTYKVTVKMKGNYTGTKTLTFKINPLNVSTCKISLSKTAFTYNGKAQKPTVTVKNKWGTKLTTSSYTVSYASGRKNVGTYKVTIKMKGNYTGSKTLTFKINPKAASVNTLTAGSKKLTVKLNRSLQQSTGYQIQYSTSKTFKNAKTKTVTSYKTSSTTLTGLKAKTTYYVRVRTYKTIGKTKYYSNWSSYKYKKTK